MFGFSPFSARPFSTAEIGGPATVVPVDSAEHLHTATQPIVTAVPTVQPDSSEHTHTASQPSVVAVPMVQPDSSEHVHTVSEPKVVDPANIQVNRGLWVGGTVASITPGLNSWAALANAGIGDTETENGNSAFTWTPSTGRLTLPSSNLPDGYLVVAAIQYSVSHGDRGNFQLRWQHNSGTGTFNFSPASGFARNTTNAKLWAKTSAFIHNPSAGAVLELQWQRDVGSGTLTGGIDNTQIEIIPFWYDNIGMYERTSGDLLGGTTPNILSGFSELIESDPSSIEMTGGNTFTIKGNNKRYYILGGQYAENFGSIRSQRWHGMEIDGAWQYDAMAYSYMRYTNAGNIGDFFHTVEETATADKVIQAAVYSGDGVLNNQGGAENIGTSGQINSQSMMVILELPDRADCFRSSGNAVQDIGVTSNVDLQFGVDFNDTDSFTNSISTEMIAARDGQYFLGGNVGAASTDVTNTARLLRSVQITVDQVAQINTITGDYGRGDQTTTGTFGWGATVSSTLDLTDGQDIGLQVQDEGNDGTFSVQSGWLGFFGINIDSMAPVYGTVVSPDSAEHLHTAGQPTITGIFPVSPDSAEHLHTASEPTVVFNVPVVSPDDATHLHTATEPTVTPLLSGVVTGQMNITGTSAAAVDVTGTVVGNLSPGATAAGNVVDPPITGTAVGSLSIDGSAAVSVDIGGVGSGSLSADGASEGEAISLTSGTAAGELSPTGSADVSVDITGSSVGELTPSGLSSSSVEISGDVSGSLGPSGSSSGIADTSGVVDAVLDIIGGTQGSVGITGSAGGTLEITGQAVLDALTIDITDPNEQFVVLPESRDFVVEGEDRTFVVEAESTNFIVVPENTNFIVPLELRDFVVPSREDI